MSEEPCLRGWNSNRRVKTKQKEFGYSMYLLAFGAYSFGSRSSRRGEGGDHENSDRLHYRGHAKHPRRETRRAEGLVASGTTIRLDSNACPILIGRGDMPPQSEAAPMCVASCGTYCGDRDMRIGRHANANVPTGLRGHRGDELRIDPKTVFVGVECRYWTESIQI